MTKKSDLLAEAETLGIEGASKMTIAQLTDAIAQQAAQVDDGEAGAGATDVTPPRTEAPAPLTDADVKAPAPALVDVEGGTCPLCPRPYPHSHQVLTRTG